MSDDVCSDADEPRAKRQNIVQSDVTQDAAKAAMSKLRSEGKLKNNLRGLPDDSRYAIFTCVEHRVDERKRKVNTSGKRSSTGRAMVNVQVADSENGYRKFLTYAVSMRASNRVLADKTKTEQHSHLCHNGLVCVKAEHIHVEAETLNQRRKGCAGWLHCNQCREMRKLCGHTHHTA